MSFDAEGRYLAFLSRQNLTGHNPSGQWKLFIAEIAFDADPPTTTPTVTRTPAVPGACVGDCCEDTEVTVDEIITMVNIALGSANMSGCTPGDASHDNEITVDEIIAAVNSALNGCND